MAISPEPTTIEADFDWVPEDTFGNRLALLRNQLQLNLEEAASACGIPRATWASWENGRKPHNLTEKVELIHRGLRVNRMWLLLGAEGQNWKERNPRPLVGLPTNLDPEPTDPTVPAVRLAAVPG